MLHQRIVFVLCILVLLVSAPSMARAKEPHVVRRAAFDIGSVNFKCTVADVDAPNGRIVKIVETMSEKVGLADDLSRSYDGNFSREAMDKGLAVVEHFKQEALRLGATEFAAIGGADISKARNGRAYLVTMEDETDITCRLVSEQQAAMLSYHAVRQALVQPRGELVVWDIGGGSAQMTMRNVEGGLTFYLDSLASIPFKNLVVETVQGKNKAISPSPNPMSERDVRNALFYVGAHVAVNVPHTISHRLQHGGVQVVGIGGVHRFAVPELLGTDKNTYTRQEVAQAIARWTGKEDADFKSEYAESRLTSLILVQGYMDALDIESVDVVSINLADGLLVAPEFW